MQPSDQQPAEETPKQENEVEHAALQPIYEFPPDGSLASITPRPAPITRVLPPEELESVPLEEAIRQGLVYPPPPAYYQNMSFPPEPPALSPQNQAHQSPPNTNVYAPPAPGYLQPASIQTSPPPWVSSPVPPHAKKSNRWVWIIVTIISVFVLAGCGLCSWGLYNIFSSTYQQVSGALNVVDDFYTNLQSKNYSAAYSDLAPQGQISGLTETAFTAQASKIAEQDGLVVSFVPGQPSFRTDPNTGPDLSHFTITVDVKRHSSSYTVLLSLAKINGTWKITDYDRL
jgi:hypothetical protein